MSSGRSKVTAQGQISILAEVRHKLGIGPGSLTEWTEEDDRMAVRRAGRFTSEDIHQTLFGKQKPSPRTVDQMKEGIRSHLRKR
jgi:AbrB family looped-hinge helix DNA binding protein